MEADELSALSSDKEGVSSFVQVPSQYSYLLHAIGCQNSFETYLITLLHNKNSVQNALKHWKNESARAVLSDAPAPVQSFGHARSSPTPLHAPPLPAYVVASQLAGAVGVHRPNITKDGIAKKKKASPMAIIWT